MPDSSGFHHEYPMLEHTKIYNNMIQHGNTAMQVTKCNSTILGRVHKLYNHTEPLELRGCRFENQWVNTGMDLKEYRGVCFLGNSTMVSVASKDWDGPKIPHHPSIVRITPNHVEQMGGSTINHPLQ